MRMLKHCDAPAGDDPQTDSLMQITLPRTPVLGAVAALSLLLAACGGSDQPATQDAGADAGSASAVSADATTDASSDASTTDATQLAAGPNSEAGEVLYARCIACHQTTGAGLPGAFPPLAGSEWVNGNPAVPIRILLHGMQGAITVAGAEYNGVMLPYGGTGEMSDDEVAAVLTYVRGAFGNSASAVTAAQVAAERAATAGRTTAWTAADLRPLLQ